MASDEKLAEYAQNLNETFEHLSTFTTPAERAIAGKAILQTEVMGYSGIDDVFETERPVDIGIFRVFPTEATIDWSSPSGEFEIRAGQTYLDFHLPKSDGISVSAANQGYSQIAEYMRSRPHISHIMGITYRVMALSAARNQGFNTEEIQLPEAIMKYASAYWQNMMPGARSRQFQTAHIVWLDRETFINRFAADQVFLGTNG